MRLLAVGLGFSLTAAAVSPTSADDTPPPPRPQVSAFRFGPQPLRPGDAGAFRFLTSREGGATISIARERAGRRTTTTGRCAVPRHPPSGTVCLRTVPVGRLRFAVDAGEGLRRFDGRLHGRAIAPGRYRATLRVVNLTLGSSDPAQATLRVVPR